MRYIAHLLSVVLLVPGIVVASALLALGHVTAQSTLSRLIDALLEVLIAFLPYALLVTIAWFALAVLGLSRRWHRLASILVAVVAMATSGIVFWVANAPQAWSDAGLFVPAAGAIVIAVWLASTAPTSRRSPRRSRGSLPDVAPAGGDSADEIRG